MERYCALLQSYSDAVQHLTGLDSEVFAERSRQVEELRLTVRQARRDWEEHEKSHGCVKKPAHRTEGSSLDTKTG